MGVYLKDATTLVEQIAILKERNLTINDELFAKESLANVGYFRFKGYCLPFYESKDRFKENVSFEEVYNVYCFDEKLRLLLFKLIEHIEVAFKSKIGYYFALEYTPIGHYKEVYFFKYGLF